MGWIHEIRPFCMILCKKEWNAKSCAKENEEHDEEDEENFRENGESENDASKKWKWKMTPYL